MTTNTIREEGKAMLFGLRLMTEEEQKIAYAMLEGMRLQQTLDAQRKTDQRDSS